MEVDSRAGRGKQSSELENSLVRSWRVESGNRTPSSPSPKITKHIPRNKTGLSVPSFSVPWATGNHEIPTPPGPAVASAFSSPRTGSSSDWDLGRAGLVSTDPRVETVLLQMLRSRRPFLVTSNREWRPGSSRATRTAEIGSRVRLRWSGVGSSVHGSLRTKNPRFRAGRAEDRRNLPVPGAEEGVQTSCSCCRTGVFLVL